MPNAELATGARSQNVIFIILTEKSLACFPRLLCPGVPWPGMACNQYFCIQNPKIWQTGQETQAKVRRCECRMSDLNQKLIDLLHPPSIACQKASSRVCFLLWFGKLPPLC